MTIYRTCAGCILNKAPCPAREAVKAKLKGLGALSILWKCADRKPRFEIGDPIFARTIAGGDQYDPGSGEGDLYPTWDDFSGVVVANAGTKCIVFIKPGTIGAEENTFEPKKGSGFCKIPISRLSARTGDRVRICPSCKNPESESHLEGYSCRPWKDPEF